MFAVSEHFRTLLSSLPSHSAPQDVIQRLVRDALEQSKSSSSTDNRRAQWEFLLRNEVLTLAQSESSFDDEPDKAYFATICDRLDVILAFSEEDAVEQSFLITILQDLLETQTIASCSHIFSWMERRRLRLTKGLVPGKAKALVLLRTLNDLLSRVSKMGDTTTLCGRILTFLSASLPLGERSGVNLRGDYGPEWDTVTFREEVKIELSMEVDQPQKVKEDTMAVDGEGNEKTEPPEEKKVPRETEAEKRENFYNTFWSLQLPFSRPTHLATPGAFEGLKKSITLVMPVIKEATVKERAMMGSKALTGTSKRKRDLTPTAPSEESTRKYFFSKFLTSPDLLELEIADTSFRRQFLFQLLILLSHLLRFTKAEKAKWYHPRNRSLQMDFTLEPDDAKWVQETMTKVYDEIKQTAPNGRAFVETVQTVLEREKNWVRWKNNFCEPFEKPSLPLPIEEEAKDQLEKLKEPLEEYPHKLGSAALSEIWALGYRDLRDLENISNLGQVSDFVRDIQRADSQINLRKSQLEKQARARAAAAAAAKAPAIPDSKPAPIQAPASPAPQRAIPPLPAASPPLHPSLPAKPGTQPITALPQPSPTPTPQPASAPVTVVSAPVPLVNLEAKDPMIMKTEESKQRTSWLALRLARDEYLHLFKDIGNGDVVKLAQAIEQEKEKPVRSASVPANGDSVGGALIEEGNDTIQQDDSHPDVTQSLSQPEKELDTVPKEESEKVAKAEVPSDKPLAAPDSNMSIDG